MIPNTNLSSSLLILPWNANGLHNHKNEFQLLLEENNIDIALIFETHFTPQSFVIISGYQVYHTRDPDGTAHTGSAIYIKNNISYHPLTPFSEDYL